MRVSCYSCPYIDKEELRQRREYLRKEEAIMECWCEKTGGKLSRSGTCPDAIQELPPPPYKAKRKVRSKRERDKKYKNKLKRMYEMKSGYYPAPAYPVDKYGDFTDEKDEIAYYKREYLSSGRSRGGYIKSMKRHSNKTVRRFKGEIPKGNSYRKIYDYWWAIL